MSLRLEALSAADGAGIVRNRETLRLLRPPYTIHNSPVLPEESIQDAILRHGFTASHEEFETWEAAINFLNQQVVEARRALRMEIPESIPGGDIVEVAPEEVISSFLARVETELIPQGKYDHAENLLFALLASNTLARYPTLGAKATKLFRQNRAARDQAETGISELTSLDLRFRSLERHGQLDRSKKRSEDIKRWGCIFAPCL
jgi:hypothetical protein